MADTRQIHFTGSIVSRNQGQSAVEHAAYRSGKKLYLDREGESFDYTKKRGVLYTEIMLADHAPPEWKDCQMLWNAVEDFEKKSDAQLARSLEFSLPFAKSQKYTICSDKCRQKMKTQAKRDFDARAIENEYDHIYKNEAQRWVHYIHRMVGIISCSCMLAAVAESLP